jgi:hypothetical protein
MMMPATMIFNIQIAATLECGMLNRRWMTDDIDDSDHSFNVIA